MCVTIFPVLERNGKCISACWFVNQLPFLPLQWVSGLFRGVLYGATRGVMTGKKGNKNFYKGLKGKIYVCCNICH